MPAKGYRNKSEVFEYVRSQTGYGRRVAEKKLDQLEREGKITPVPDPGRAGVMLYADADVEKIVAALTLPPPR